MSNAMLMADLRTAYRAGGVGAAAELARARGLVVPAGAELSDLELEVVAAGGGGGKGDQNGRGRGNGPGRGRGNGGGGGRF